LSVPFETVAAPATLARDEKGSGTAAAPDGPDAHVFAIRLEGPTFASIRDERVRLTKQILADRGLMN
jgi:hypothetical protein